MLPARHTRRRILLRDPDTRPVLAWMTCVAIPPSAGISIPRLALGRPADASALVIPRNHELAADIAARVRIPADSAQQPRSAAQAAEGGGRLLVGGVGVRLRCRAHQRPLATVLVRK